MARIIQFLDGGLGNQLFQYANCYAVARDNKMELSIYSMYNDLMPGSRENGLRFFSILSEYNKFIPKRLILEGIKCISKRYINLIFKIQWNSDVNINTKYISTINEKCKQFAPMVLEKGKDFYILKGFWQSSLYFSKYREEIIKLFTPTEEYIERVMKRPESKLIVEDIFSVSIHVRHGDFQKIGWVLDPEYYQRAISIILKKLGIAHFYVFSDDINWCRDYFSDLENVVFVESDKNNLSYEDMYLMSQCRHNIIANSTYSWWGAYLNNNQNKIIVAPKQIVDSTNLDILSGLSWEII